MAGCLGNGRLRQSWAKAFSDFPFSTRVYLWTLNARIDNRSAEIYCYFVICGNTAGNACFEISPQKAFSDFPYNTRVYLWKLNALIDNSSNRVSNS
ncbi:hypothetical protein P7K49_040360 [Saguinus oedipus]|uniref:Uncharacterized protein n=1 Tax=Saguinus oedipus TaxID=9490 RepID=A0ABQ9T9M6_SAGOE|nr:hypothetical protein P7K49_040360 [Saguinus oedipus]